MGRLEIKPGSNGEQNRIYWGDGKTPNRKRAVNGVVVTERISAVPSRQYVNAAGNLVAVAVANAAADVPNGDYGTKIEMCKRAAGMVPADTCPLADRTSLQWFDGVIDYDDKPCSEYVRGDGMPLRLGPDKPCKHTKQLIKVRAEAHAIKEKAFADTVFANQFLKQGEMIASSIKEAITEAASMGRRQGSDKAK